jgi:hypothetical protein
MMTQLTIFYVLLLIVGIAGISWVLWQKHHR